MFVFSDEKNGIKVNEGVLYRNVFVQLKHSPHVAMEVPTIEIKPKVTKKENQKTRDFVRNMPRTSGLAVKTEDTISKLPCNE